MAIDFGAVGVHTTPVTVVWDERDTLLYALAVGAGQEGPLSDLHHTTENSEGVRQQVIPTFAITLVHRAPAPFYGRVDRSKVLHGEQQLTVSAPIPVAGAARVSSVITEIQDKGSGALVVTEATALAPDSGNLMFATRSATFVRGAGGFGDRTGEERAPSASAVPERVADVTLETSSRSDQALLYRLTGDRNPLHSDPALAALAGYDRPILHGLCTLGIATRVLTHALCDADATRVRGVSARFSRPVMPGEPLAIDVWHENSSARFQARTEGGLVLDRGRFQFESGATL
jgi:acyl dehydratase